MEALIVCCCNDSVYFNLVFFVLSFKFSEKYKKGKEKNKITINSIKIFLFFDLEVVKILWFCIRFFIIYFSFYSSISRFIPATFALFNFSSMFNAVVNSLKSARF
jgi:hypothetical protein